LKHLLFSNTHHDNAWSYNHAFLATSLQRPKNLATWRDSNPGSSVLGGGRDDHYATPPGQNFQSLDFEIDLPTQVHRLQTHH
jgi:alpha-D-ribose 1-methylphosphonate 5-phosphate C-P lyase